MDLIIWFVGDILVETLGANTFPLNILSLKGLT
jgi:hypothetical protein